MVSMCDFKVLLGISRFLLIPLYIYNFCCSSNVTVQEPANISENLEPVLEIQDRDSLTLSWEYPKLEAGDPICSFEVLYRAETDTTWTMLRNNIPPATQPEIVVHRSDLSSTDSIFNFQFRYIDKNNIVSQPHFSYDSTASPAGGWLLLWK